MFSVFELYFLYWFKASEFNEKKEKTLKHLDDLTALNRSVDVRDKREVHIQNLYSIENCQYNELSFCITVVNFV